MDLKINKNMEIKEVLLKFQEGYKKRDFEQVDEFVNELFINSDDTLIIGTGNGEWCRGLDQIKELIHIDWFYWGNFQLDMNNLLIKVNSNFATVAATAILQKQYEDGKLNDLSIKRMKKIIESDGTSQEKIYKALKTMAYFLHEDQVGKDVKRKVRFSASLIKDENVWKFTDIHYSYPVSPPSDIKLVCHE